MTRLVFLHGFTQTGASWRHLRALLADHDSVAPDLPGHGTDIDARRDLWRTAADIGRAAGAGVYVGYSFGARVALHCALTDPVMPTGLVLVSGTAGIDDPEERATRRAADETLADRICRIGVEPFLDEWLGQPMFAGLDDEQADRSSRTSNTADGLADSLRFCGTGTQEPLWNRLSGIGIPVLVVAGEHDAKFRQLAERLAGAISNSSLAVVAGCGHSVPFEKPGALAELIRAWLVDTALL